MNLPKKLLGGRLERADLESPTASGEEAEAAMDSDPGWREIDRFPSSPYPPSFLDLEKVLVARVFELGVLNPRDMSL